MFSFYSFFFIMPGFELLYKIIGVEDVDESGGGVTPVFRFLDPGFKAGEKTFTRYIIRRKQHTDREVSRAPELVERFLKLFFRERFQMDAACGTHNGCSIFVSGELP